MFKEIKCFKWNSKLELPDLNLGDDIQELINKSIITVKYKYDKLEYFYTKDDRIWLTQSDGYINQIYFTECSGCEILSIDPFKFQYPSTKAITKLLSSHFEKLDNLSSLSEIEKTYTGDILIVIFRDYIPKNMLIKRIKKPHSNK